MDILSMERKAAQLRLQVLEMIYEAKQGHIGGGLSSAEILVSLFYNRMRCDSHNPQWPDRDRFVLSKGHCVEGYLVTLADLGYFPREELAAFCAFGSRLIGHPSRKVPGVEMNTGSLGHGLSGACGMALSAKMDGKAHRVYVLMGDGELGEGSVWEAAMLAADKKLDNLYAVIDRNRLQISGPTEQTLALEPLKQKWEAFGFAVEEADGHSFADIDAAFNRLDAVTGKPKLLLANTVKGKGISYLENTVGSHHMVPSSEKYTQAKNELLAAIKEKS